MADEPPEEVLYDGSRWIRRDVFIEEMVEDEGADREKVSDALDEMVARDDEPMRSVRFGDYEYVQLTSRTAAMAFYLRGKTKLGARSARERARDIFTSGDGDG